METGQLINRIDNNVIDSSDSTLPEESEVSVKTHNITINFYHPIDIIFYFTFR